MNEIKRFKSDLKANEELRTKYESAIKEIAAAGEVKSDGEAMVRAAAQLGYSFTVTDLEKAFAEQQEMSEAELDTVTGGIGSTDEDCYAGYSAEDEYGHDVDCITVWHCLVASMHTETESKEVSCLYDYLCAVLWVNNN